jgi:hypothetical protein
MSRKRIIPMVQATALAVRRLAARRRHAVSCSGVAVSFVVAIVCIVGAAETPFVPVGLERETRAYPNLAEIAHRLEELGQAVGW